ncbi:hypothetical protein HK405_012974 [Cladochytrium tenue]|nr:hypothetical protein HK405_012974 [Cladochytrium tenue]
MCFQRRAELDGADSLVFKSTDDFLAAMNEAVKMLGEDTASSILPSPTADNTPHASVAPFGFSTLDGPDAAAVAGPPAQSGVRLAQSNTPDTPPPDPAASAIAAILAAYRTPTPAVNPRPEQAAWSPIDASSSSPPSPPPAAAARQYAARVFSPHARFFSGYAAAVADGSALSFASRYLQALREGIPLRLGRDIGRKGWEWMTGSQSD